MTTATARAIAYSAVALLAIAALQARPPRTPLQTPRPVVNDGSQRRPGQPGEGRGAQDLSDMEIPTFIRRQMD